jgi:hypothetical protein
METFIPARPFVPNPGFRHQREIALEKIPGAKIDPPVQNLINHISQLPYCFSLQSCCGHFIYEDKDLLNTDPLPELHPEVKVGFRIGYVALCIDDTPEGRKLYDDLKLQHEMDPDYIQFGSAEWFWNLQVNSYILQVCPERFMNEDKMLVSYPEALHIENVRNRCLENLEELFVNRTLSGIPD